MPQAPVKRAPPAIYFIANFCFNRHPMKRFIPYLLVFVGALILLAGVAVALTWAPRLPDSDSFVGNRETTTVVPAVPMTNELASVAPLL